MNLIKNHYKNILAIIFFTVLLILLKFTYFNFITVRFALIDSPESAAVLYSSTNNDSSYNAFKDKLTVGKNNIFILPLKTDDFIIKPLISSEPFIISKIRVNGIKVYADEMVNSCNNLDKTDRTFVDSDNLNIISKSKNIEIHSSLFKKAITKAKENQQKSWYIALAVYSLLILISCFLEKIRRLLLTILRKQYLKNPTLSIFLICFIAIFLIWWPFNSISFGLDNSWVYAINKIFAKGEYLWGKDIFFTYGPLGFLAMPLNIGRNLTFAFYFYILLHMVYVGLLAYLYSIWDKESYKNLNIFLMISIFSYCLFGFDLFILILNIVLLSVLLFRKSHMNNKTNVLFLILPSFLAGISLLIKFNLALTVFGILLVMLGCFCIENKKIFYKYIVLSVLSYLIPVVLSIIFYFKNVSIFLNWLKTSWLVASGFSEAMALEGSVGYSILAGIGIVIYLYMLFRSIKNKNSDSFIYLIFAPFIFFQFKHGFVRQDGHMASYFWAMIMFVGFVVLFGKHLYKKLLVIIFICSCIYFKGFYFDLNRNIFNLVSTYIHRDQIVNADINCELPDKWVKEIGKSKVEFLPWEFSYAEKYHLNQQFNPVLQLYSVYTKKLDDLSADSYFNESAPKYIIAEFMAIDERNMFFDTPKTFEVIKENYRVESFDKDKILLEKRDKNIAEEFKTYDTSKVRVNEEITVPKGAKKAKIDLQLNLVGKMINYLFRVPPMMIDIVDTNDKSYSYRIIRDTLANGLPLVNVPTDAEGFKNWLDNKSNLLSIKKMKFNCKLNLLYKNKVNIEWQK